MRLSSFGDWNSRDYSRTAIVNPPNMISLFYSAGTICKNDTEFYIILRYSDGKYNKSLQKGAPRAYSPAKTRMAFSASSRMAFSAARARSWKKVTSSFASSSLTAWVPALDI